LIGKGCRGPKRQKSAVVPTKSILKAANVPIIGGHHILALQGSPEGWQATSLLEHCREHVDRQGRVVQRHVLYLGKINDTQELEEIERASEPDFAPAETAATSRSETAG
jgi:hypothetical protein